MISLSKLEKENGTLIMWGKNKTKEILGMNLWDIEELIEEVF